MGVMRRNANFAMTLQYYGAAFKVPTLETSSRWLVIVTGPKLIEELRNAGDETLSNYEYNLDVGTHISMLC